jgi:hypothetical protein
LSSETAFFNASVSGHAGCCAAIKLSLKSVSSETEEADIEIRVGKFRPETETY